MPNTQHDSEENLAALIPNQENHVANLEMLENCFISIIDMVRAKDEMIETLKNGIFDSYMTISGYRHRIRHLNRIEASRKARGQKRDDFGKFAKE
jgi:hypothetical protein